MYSLISVPVYGIHYNMVTGLLGDTLSYIRLFGLGNFERGIGIGVQ